MRTTGKFNQLIEIYKQVNNNNEFGGGTDINTIYWGTYANTEILKSSRTLEANQDNLRMIVRFEVRARDDREIYNDMLVKWRGKWFVIQNYNPDVVYKRSVVFDGAVMNSGDIMQGNNETT